MGLTGVIEEASLQARPIASSRLSVLDERTGNLDESIADFAEVYADPARAERLLGWRDELDVDAMCADAWRWQSANPDGYVAG